MTVTDTLAREIEGAVLEAASMLADERAVREVRAKSPTDFVTNVDFAVQEQLRPPSGRHSARSAVHGRGAGQFAP